MSFTDQDFERALLASAQADEPPADARAEMTAQAWARFSARAVALGDSLRGQTPRSETATGGGPAQTARRRVVGGVHWRWLLAGALGGGAVTAGLFALRPPVQVTSLTVGADEASPPVARPAPARRRARLVALSHRGAAGRATGEAAEPAGGTGLGRSDARSAAPPSNLAAEVAALDAARAAAASHQFDQALALISRYHYDFPAGELAADAEVIAIRGARRQE